MWSMNKLTGCFMRKVHPVFMYNLQNHSVKSGVYAYKHHNANYFTSTRNWAKKDSGCHPQRPCKPAPDQGCKAPGPKECKKKKMPYIQECAKPNLLSECPRPACPHQKKDCGGKGGIWLALLALAGTIGALAYLLSGKSKDKDVSPSIISQRLKRPHVIKKNPTKSSDIPSEVPYLLIGGGTASFAAFRAIKSNDPTACVLVISNEEQPPYMRPPLSKELWDSSSSAGLKTLDFKQWNGTQRSIYYEPEDFYMNCKNLLNNENGGVAVARGWEVSHIDVVNKVVTLEDGYKVKYGKCLIATGCLPKSLDVFESATEEVLDRTALYRTIQDFRCVHEKLQDAKSVAIVGGGFLGSELACAFAQKIQQDEEFKVYQIFKESGPLGKILPEYLSFWAMEKVKGQGVTIHPHSNVIGVSGTQDNVTMTLSDGSSITTDLVILTVGTAPNTSFADKSGLEIDPSLGGYLVNTELQARSNLYVAGDAACFYDPALGRRRIEHHDNAVISGRLAGENMTGAAKPYVHQSMFWSDLGKEIGFEAIGIVNASLPTVGVFAKTAPETPAEAVTETGPAAEKVPTECVKYLGHEEQEALEKQEQQKAQDAKAQAEARKKKAAALPGEDFHKGVVFYLRDDIIVGIVLWNVFNRMSVARQVLSNSCKYDDLNEVAKLFNIHED